MKRILTNELDNLREENKKFIGTRYTLSEEVNKILKVY